MSSFTGETKSSSASGNVAVPTFYTDVLPLIHMPNDPFIPNDHGDQSPTVHIGFKLQVHVLKNK